MVRNHVLTFVSLAALIASGCSKGDARVSIGKSLRGQELNKPQDAGVDAELSSFATSGSCLQLQDLVAKLQGNADRTYVLTVSNVDVGLVTDLRIMSFNSTEDRVWRNNALADKTGALEFNYVFGKSILKNTSFLDLLNVKSQSACEKITFAAGDKESEFTITNESAGSIFAYNETNHEQRRYSFKNDGRLVIETYEPSTTARCNLNLPENSLPMLKKTYTLAWGAAASQVQVSRTYALYVQSHIDVPVEIDNALKAEPVKTTSDAGAEKADDGEAVTRERVTTISNIIEISYPVYEQLAKNIQDLKFKAETCK